MLVTPDIFLSSIQEIQAADQIALDTETTGFRYFANSKLFGISVATRTQAYYFDYNTYFTPTLSRESHNIRFILEGYEGVIHMHNAKFDCSMLYREDVDTDKLKVNCTLQMGRLLDSGALSLSLAALTKDQEESKDGDPVKQYMLKNNLWDWELSPYKKKRTKNFYFYKVPLQIIQPYAEQDARSTLELGLRQFKEFQNKSGPSMSDLITNERRVTKVFQRMDRVGVKIDSEYTEAALSNESRIVAQSEHEWTKITGKDFVDSGVLFKSVFDELGISYPLTDKGNPSFDKKALKGIDHPLATIIKNYRDAMKRMATYDTLLSCSYRGTLHPNSRPAGCRTGRVSYSEPPMQCMEKYDPDDHEGDPDPEFLPRRCFVPREGYTFFMLDYDQFEYRMMLNYAKEMGLIKKVLAGLCVHTATGEMIGIPRRPAKTINFALLYGTGDQALATTLGLTLREGKALKAKYFRALPRVDRLISEIRNKAKRTGKLYNWFGREYKIDRGFEYKGPNYLIQGGTADWVKIAMVHLDNYLKGTKSRMLLQVHDEIIFEISNDEFHVVPILKYIMENVSNDPLHSLLPYTVGVDYSTTNWQDKVPYECTN